MSNTRWTDEYGAREFCARTMTVRIIPPPSANSSQPMSRVEEAALADLVGDEDGDR